MDIVDQFLTLDAHYHWLIVALLLGIAEILVPGVFLIWLAAAAAATGFVAMFIDINAAGQFTLFGVLALASVFFGRRWYLSSNVESEDPLLNDRSARLIGTTVTVVEAVTPTSGRVKVGDGEWPAQGPAMQAGSYAKVMDVKGGVLLLEKLEE